MDNERSNQIFGGVFLIGLAILFITNWWWPGIMYVSGIAMIARSVTQGKAWTEERAGLIVLAVGVVFTLTDVLRIFSFNWWPLLLIGVGLYLLFGNRRDRGSGDSGASGKPKNDIV
jgi:hypothetical protein